MSGPHENVLSTQKIPAEATGAKHATAASAVTMARQARGVRPAMTSSDAAWGAAVQRRICQVSGQRRGTPRGQPGVWTPCAQGEIRPLTQMVEMTGVSESGAQKLFELVRFRRVRSVVELGARARLRDDLRDLFLGHAERREAENVCLGGEVCGARGGELRRRVLGAHRGS